MLDNGHQEKYQKDGKQNTGDGSGRTGDTGKAQHPGNQSNDQKD